jgi:small redox-active disulfide protein 2
VKVQVLGPGCMKCNKQFAEAEQAVAQSGVNAQLSKVDKIEQIMQFGVMLTPALVVDGEVMCSGRVAKSPEIAGWLTAAAKKNG